jgi:hypothetical protein
MVRDGERAGSARRSRAPLGRRITVRSAFQHEHASSQPFSRPVRSRSPPSRPGSAPGDPFVCYKTRSLGSRGAYRASPRATVDVVIDAFSTARPEDQHRLDLTKALTALRSRRCRGRAAVDGVTHLEGTTPASPRPLRSSPSRRRRARGRQPIRDSQAARPHRGSGAGADAEDARHGGRRSARSVELRQLQVLRREGRQGPEGCRPVSGVRAVPGERHRPVWDARVQCRPSAPVLRARRPERRQSASPGHARYLVCYQVRTRVDPAEAAEVRRDVGIDAVRSSDPRRSRSRSPTRSAFRRSRIRRNRPRRDPGADRPPGGGGGGTILAIHISPDVRT